MYTSLLLLALFIIPILNAERYQTIDSENNPDMFMARSGATRYLFSRPIRRYDHLASDSSSGLSSSDSDSFQARGKRIYWENLAFHASDFNQKAKKL